MIKRMCLIARRSSFFIWNARHSLTWNPAVLCPATALPKPSSTTPIPPEGVSAAPSMVRDEAIAFLGNLGYSVSLPPTVDVNFRPPPSSILKDGGITKLYHFTDQSNISSIKKLGLFSWSHLVGNAIKTVCGGNSRSHKMDKEADRHDFVRLSFTPNHPMMFACKKDGRITNPVVLEVDINVILLPDTLFADRNANKKDAEVSDSPSGIRFNVVTCSSQFDVLEHERHFYQAEVLIKTHVPTKYISFDNVTSTNEQNLVVPSQTRPDDLLSTSQKKSLDLLSTSRKKSRNSCFCPSKSPVELQNDPELYWRKNASLSILFGRRPKSNRESHPKVPKDATQPKSGGFFYVNNRYNTFSHLFKSWKAPLPPHDYVGGVPFGGIRQKAWRKADTRPGVFPPFIVRG